MYVPSGFPAVELCEAELSIVPVIIPVAGSIVSPAGSPVALYVRTSVVSGSLKYPDRGRLIASASESLCAGRALLVGASFVPVTVISRVAVEVPPSPSLIV